MANVQYANWAPSQLNDEFTWKASTLTEVGDACYLDEADNTMKPASSFTDQGSAAATRRAFAALYAGIALNRQLSTDSTGRPAKLLIDTLIEFPCASATFEAGDYVGPTYTAGVLSDQEFTKVTDPREAIGKVVKRYASATTTVKVRVTSKVLMGLLLDSQAPEGVEGIPGDAAGEAGAALTYAGGQGGLHTTGTGGAGGAATWRGGLGAASTSGTGGAGGATTVGGATGGASSSGTGGAGGAVSVTGGTGGASSTGAGGAGASVTVSGGTGGAATAGTGNGGAGGNLTLNAGAGGATTGGAAGAGGNVRLANNVALPAGGSAAGAVLLSSTASFGIYFGSGAPTVSAAQGSIYLRSDGSSTSTRLYVNTTGSTTWTNVTTAA